jgi:hypothetical protein
MYPVNYVILENKFLIVLFWIYIFSHCDNYIKKLKFHISNIYICYFSSTKYDALHVQQHQHLYY